MSTKMNSLVTFFASLVLTAPVAAQDSPPEETRTDTTLAAEHNRAVHSAVLTVFRERVPYNGASVSITVTEIEGIRTLAACEAVAANAARTVKGRSGIVCLDGNGEVAEAYLCDSERLNSRNKPRAVCEADPGPAGRD